MVWNAVDCDAPENQKALSIARAVFEDLGLEAQEAIAKVCSEVTFCGSAVIDRSGLYPGDIGVFSFDLKKVSLWVPALEHASELAIKGLVAHELGHAYDCATTGRCGQSVAPRDIAEAEERANQHASGWGFGEAIEAAHTELDARFF